MNLLLDTHAFIWWDDDTTKLSPTALAACMDANNTLLLSIASIWEMQIKVQLGKLTFSVPLPNKIENQRRTNGLQILPIEIPHVFAMDRLPNHHRDPFDRLLIAQAIYENIAFITHDPEIARYPVNILW